ncbi:hypothetical protein BpHYR1_030788 [Brachionus plicatilis]|uniref:Uncharacterized protein n=1 Tax=Brachionus plicatilis TaxID=10195 RepID=A0A3M7RJH1_BRAPC|nr:hypothetical protein BpHYR1_030788 [Brachionus plicatilis]
MLQEEALSLFLNWFTYSFCGAYSHRYTRQNTIDPVNDLDVTDIEDKDEDEQENCQNRHLNYRR